MKWLQIEGINQFEDLASGDVRGHSARAEQWLIDYLRKATVFIYSPGIVHDVLNPEQIAGTGSVLTDGEWAWSDALPHYVGTYGFPLPPAFLEHARATPVVEVPRSVLRVLRLE